MTHEAPIQDRDQVSGNIPQQPAESVSAGSLLIVDDNEMNLDLLSRILTRRDFTVTTAGGGAAAIKLLEHSSFDTVLLDIMMPEVSGWDVLTWIRQRHSREQLPVIMATAKDSSDDVVQALKMGANDYVTKPLDLKVVQARVDTHVNLKRTSESLVRMNQELKQHASQLETSNRELNRAKAELEKKNQELDEFTYVASHDLQEPVRKLISYSDLLKQDLAGDINERASRDLHFIVDAAVRMRRLIQDLLALSRVGRSAMKQEPVRIGDCLADALDALQLRIQETAAKVESPDLPTVIGDQTMLTQLYQNLVGNALKFKAETAPLVQLTAEDEGDQWILGVKDNGIGLSDEASARIFKPFQRLHRREEFEGTGIGLSICKKTVERHGGRLWVESSEGNGAHFKFSLPKQFEGDVCTSIE
jgi:signal transduction histidine kinase